MNTSSQRFTRSFQLGAWFACFLLIQPHVKAAEAQEWPAAGSLNCSRSLRQFDPLLHKAKYRMGVHATRGLEAAVRDYNKTFAEYLTETAGRRFDPSIEFEMVPNTMQGIFQSLEEDGLDFLFANPGVYSCVGVEYGAQPLATVVSRLEVRGHVHDLDVYGGVMFTQAENDEINSVADFTDKVIGAGGISMIMAGQLQFYEMEKAGLSYAMGPKQVVFTGNEADVVNGVLAGDFDVGFARTDQIERTKDENGDGLDSDIFKIIKPRVYVLDDGSLFPFLHSTDIYPEWPVAALGHVHKDVAEEVQNALLALQDHADVAHHYQDNNDFTPTRCDTTKELSELAWDASVHGSLAGFRNARSYFEVRSMHEAAGFLHQDERGDWKCTSADTLYESVKCPEGHYKVPLDDYKQSCENAGLVCKEGYDCYCKPCIKAHEADVFQCEHNDSYIHVERHIGCDKMSLCASVQQTKSIQFRIRDNKQRDDAVFTVKMHLASETYEIPVIKVDDYRYKFHWSSDTVGVGIMEVLLDGEQIPESPLRVQVVERLCDIDYPGQKKVADGSGNCKCKDGTMHLGNKCVSSTVIAILISVSFLVLVVIAGSFYIQYRNRKNDQMWIVGVDELHFGDSGDPEVIGQGSFGVVLLAEYRGTKVAIKRAVKTDGKRGSTRASRGSRRVASVGSSKGMGSKEDCTGSVDMNSRASSEPHPAQHPDQVDLEFGLDESVTRSRESGVASQGKSKSANQYSLGFLAEDFGKNSKWARLFPWLKRDTYHSRFKEAILGNSASSMSKKTFGAMLCPWLSEQARREEEFVNEMRVLSRLRHPCITTVMGAVLSRSHDAMLVMEYMEYGSLHDLLRNESMHLSGEIIMQVSRDVAQGLRYLHSSKPPILHGDLKARNILIDSRFRAKLCDFGLSTKKKNLITGTPFWLAPEYLRGQTNYNPPCDIYSVGIILFEIYSRGNPYQGEEFREVLRKVCDRRINKRPMVPDTCPPKMADLMKKCWSPDPFVRPEAKDLDMALMDMSILDAEPVEPEEQQKKLAEKQRTGDMLYELFPKHIADALKAGQKVEPESHALVTVVFSEIVDFAEISRDISPMKISNMLDRLYLTFDKIARKHHVFKVETVGDAYMGVTNLENNQGDTHVKQVAEFAVDMIREASKILVDEEAPHKGFIPIRVGFHSGPVVSNVIGSLNPRYGLFGDTVNTASRMESNSRAHRILCSEKSCNLLREQANEMPIRKRGKIAVKGKGDMAVYWVGDNLLSANSNNKASLPVTIGPKETAKKVGFDVDG